MSETDSNHSISSIASETDFELNSAWDVYFSRNDVQNYDERLVYVTSFNTVQGFWAVYQHLKLPSHLRQGCDYMFFRSGIQPYWESKENKNGGRVLLEIKKQNRNSELVSKWLETLLALIGEQLSEPSDINGAVVQSRRQADRISVWTRSSDESMRQVAENYQKLVKSSTGLKFQSHLNRTSSLNLRYSFHVPPVFQKQRAVSTYYKTNEPCNNNELNNNNNKIRLSSGKWVLQKIFAFNLENFVLF